jgi:hypothetical protein
MCSFSNSSPTKSIAETCDSESAFFQGGTKKPLNLDISRNALSSRRSRNAGSANFRRKNTNPKGTYSSRIQTAVRRGRVLEV